MMRRAGQNENLVEKVEIQRREFEATLATEKVEANNRLAELEMRLTEVQAKNKVSINVTCMGCMLKKYFFQSLQQQLSSVMEARDARPNSDLELKMALEHEREKVSRLEAMRNASAMRDEDEEELVFQLRGELGVLKTMLEEEKRRREDLEDERERSVGKTQIRSRSKSNLTVRR